MYIEFDDTAASHILWHDAEVRHIYIQRLDDRTVTVHIPIEVNSEESLDPMIVIGLNSFSLLIEYRDVWRFISDIRGDSLSNEVIIDWEIIQDSGVIKQLKAIQIDPRLVGRLRHHQYRLSGGTKLDVIFEGMYVAQRSTD